MLTNCFKYLDYRSAIRDEVSARKSQGERMSFHKLAEAVRVQPPYVSKVMREDAHFSRDQLFQALRLVAASPAQSAYMELLHDFQTSGVESRRQELLARISAIQADHLDTQRHLQKARSPTTAEFEEYYLDPLNQIVHVCLSIPRYRRNPDLLARDLLVPRESVRGALRTLERIGAARRDDAGGFVPVGDTLHLPRDSRLYGAWDTQLRQMAAVRRQHLPKSLSYGFSVVFSADEPTRHVIQEKLLELVASLQKVVAPAAEEEVYQLSLDMFSWTRQSQ